MRADNHGEGGIMALLSLAASSVIEKPRLRKGLLVIGVFGAALRLFGWYREDLIKLPFYDNDPVSQLVSSTGFLALCLYLWFRAMKKEKTA